MGETVNARIPPRVEQKLAQYCARQGVTRTEAIVRALDQYLDQSSGGPDAYSLAADLIPPEGVPALQSDRVRDAARKAFGVTRPR